MDITILLSLVGFAFVTSATPGPNTLMLLTSGTNFGFRRTVPHMAGIGIGVFILLLCTGFGLAALLTSLPVVFTALKLAGGAYLLYLAWRIATTREVGEGKSAGRPMSFLEAALFQWINPKAWAISVTAMTTYTSKDMLAWSTIIVAVVFFLINVPSASIWTLFGVWLREWLREPLRLKVFNITMAVLLVASLWPMLR